MKILVTLLMMAVIFLSGIVFGMNRDTISQPPVNELSAEQETVEVKEEVKEEVAIAVPPAADMEMQPDLAGDSPAFHTQKAASVLGAAVKGFFEIIMQFMYQTAQLFF